MEQLLKWWRAWGDEVIQVLSAFGLLALVSLFIVAFAGPDAAPYDITVIQSLMVTLVKFATFSAVAHFNVWSLEKKWWDGSHLPAQTPDRWQTYRVYFLSLAALVLLSFT